VKLALTVGLFAITIGVLKLSGAAAAGGMV